MELSHGQRLTLGLAVLTLVDILWVASSELTEYIFKDDGFSKPFFSTYLKNALFSVFLLGFVVWPPWRAACLHRQELLVPLEALAEDGSSSAGSPAPDSPGLTPRRGLSEPEFVPVLFDEDKSSGTDSEDQTAERNGRRSVRFNRVMEVRQLSERDAGSALFARLSYRASLQVRRQLLRSAARLPPAQVALLALQFALPFVCGQYSYQLALSRSEAAYVNILSSSSGLFTLILAAIYPSTSGDKLTLSKLLATSVNIAGVVAVSLSTVSGPVKVPTGALWALAGAFLYAAYIVLLRAKVDHEDKLDLPMFFGFVGLFSSLLFWPGFLIGHYAGYEPFQLPNKQQWMVLIANGLLGTVLSELLWMWGCLLTSSLIATLSLSATIPLTMLADMVLRNVRYPAMFYLGAVPIFAASLIVTVLSHWNNWDPAAEGLRRLAMFCCPRSCCSDRPHRSDPAGDEQSTSLIEDSDDDDEDMDSSGV